MANRINPLQLLDKCIDQKVYLVMTGNLEVSGVLKGFNEHFHLVL